jgi:hypothetical protein
VNVAALQQHLHDLAAFLTKVGGNNAKAIADLNAVRDGLTPFADHKFEDFAAFLRLALQIADEFKRTGQVPIPPPKAKKAPAVRTPKPPKLTLDAARVLVRTLYEAAPKPGFAADRLDAELAKLNDLKVTDLKTVAAEADAGGRVKKMKKPDVIAEIKRSILGRKAAPERDVQ